MPGRDALTGSRPRLKRWKIRSRSAASMPGPVSEMEMRSRAGVSAVGAARTSTRPAEVNLTALLTRLNNTCRSRAGSTSHSPRNWSSQRTRSSSPLSRACGASTSATSRTSEATSTGSGWMLARSASLAVRSSKPFSMPSKAWPLERMRSSQTRCSCSRSPSSISPQMPMMVVIGVRMSWPSEASTRSCSCVAAAAVASAVRAACAAASPAASARHRAVTSRPEHWKRPSSSGSMVRRWKRRCASSCGNATMAPSSRVRPASASSICRATAQSGARPRPAGSRCPTCSCRSAGENPCTARIAPWRSSSHCQSQPKPASRRCRPVAGPAHRAGQRQAGDPYGEQIAAQRRDAVAEQRTHAQHVAVVDGGDDGRVHMLQRHRHGPDRGADQQPVDAFHQAVGPARRRVGLCRRGARLRPDQEAPVVQAEPFDLGAGRQPAMRREALQTGERQHRTHQPGRAALGVAHRAPQHDAVADAEPGLTERLQLQRAGGAGHGTLKPAGRGDAGVLGAERGGRGHQAAGGIDQEGDPRPRQQGLQPQHPRGGRDAVVRLDIGGADGLCLVGERRERRIDGAGQGVGGQQQVAARVAPGLTGLDSTRRGPRPRATEAQRPPVRRAGRPAAAAR